MTLAPLGWVALFSIRFLKEWHNKKEAKKEEKRLNPKSQRPKSFIDPDELIKKKESK